MYRIIIWAKKIIRKIFICLFPFNCTVGFIVFHRMMLILFFLKEKRNGRANNSFFLFLFLEKKNLNRSSSRPTPCFLS